RHAVLHPDRDLLRAAVLLDAGIAGKEEGVKKIVLLSIFLAGCSIGPDYKRPELDTPPQWRVDYPTAADAANTLGWKQFDDPGLDARVGPARRETLATQAAPARVDQFLGALTSPRSQFSPRLGYGGEASRNRASRVGQPPLGPNVDPWYNLYQGALTA